MKIFIPSKGRPMEISTHLLFKDYIIVLHNETEKEEYLKNPTIDPSKVVVSNVAYGVSLQRQWILDNLIEKDEWYVSLDDNIKYFTCVPEPEYSTDSLPVQKDKSTKDLFETKIEKQALLDLFEKLKEKGEKERCYNIGFGTTPNFFFRGNHFRYVGYVISKACIRKNVGISFDLNVKAMDDYSYTADVLLEHGKVLIDNYVFAVAGHYEKGGIGTYKDRLPLKIADGEYLMRKFPGLFRYNNKKTGEEKAELSIRFTSLKQVEQWRAFMRGKIKV